MPFTIVRNDITHMRVDAIVNSANPLPVVGLGTDSMIHERAGPQLLEARQKIGPIKAGHAAITPAFGLDAKYVIHTVGPVWVDGRHGEETLLYSCYAGSLQLALEHGCKSVALPLISTNNYGFPKDRALKIAVSVFSDFVLHHEIDIYLVVFDRTAYRLSGQLFCDVQSYIDQHYVDACQKAIYGTDSALRRENARSRMQVERRVMELLDEEMRAPAPMEVPPPPSPARKKLSLAEMLKRKDAGFTETLLKLIDKSGKKDSEVYKKANLSKQHFSKIRNNPDYKPTKPTAIALALALELDLAQTKDLIGRAGYALTDSSKFDLIIRYFIEQGNYNVVEINIALYEFDQSLLGS